MSAYSNSSVVILCGGRGRRLGSLGDSLPKVMAPVYERPILWYSLLRLHMAGFRHFILPLGYLGDTISSFIHAELSNLDATIDAIDTGAETPIGQRLCRVRDHLRGDNFFLVNGDTLFDFDIAGTFQRHVDSGLDLTLTSCQVVSQYGLLVTNETGELVDFARDCPVRQFGIERPGRGLENGYINSGIAILRRSTLDYPGVDSTRAFEQHLYPRLIEQKQARHEHIEGFWHAIDTQKDLEIANNHSGDMRGKLARGLYEALTAYAKSPQFS